MKTNTHYMKFLKILILSVFIGFSIIPSIAQAAETIIKDIKIDIYGYFASDTSGELKCKIPLTEDECDAQMKKIRAADKSEKDYREMVNNGCFEYLKISSSEDIKKCTSGDFSKPNKFPGQVVQRLEIASSEGAPGIINAYIGKIFILGIGVGAGFSVLMIVIGGIQTITSSSSDGSIKGKERIIQALIGIAILLLTSVILHSINPNYFNL